MIGTYEEARQAADGELEAFAYGSSRRCHRIGDVVYKVNRHHAWDANMDEWNKYQKIVEMVRDDAIISVPETRLISVNNVSVIAMRYIAGTPKLGCYCIEGRETHSDTCLPKDVYTRLLSYVEDLGGENVMFDGERYWIIDLGEQ